MWCVIISSYEVGKEATTGPVTERQTLGAPCTLPSGHATHARPTANNRLAWLKCERRKISLQSNDKHKHVVDSKTNVTLNYSFVDHMASESRIENKCSFLIRKLDAYTRRR